MIFTKFDVRHSHKKGVTLNTCFAVFKVSLVVGDLKIFFKTFKVFDLAPRMINIEFATANLQVFDLSPCQGKIEHLINFEVKLKILREDFYIFFLH